MNETLNFAAIDIGSNAARLLIAGTPVGNPTTPLSKIILLRYPLRLGEDVFSKGEISKAKIEKTLLLMKAYKHLLRLYNVVAMRACATSAMRDAKNGNEIVKLIAQKTGININIINGREEAGIIFESHIADVLPQDKNYLYVDVGGGSTEINLIVEGKLKQTKSINIGTLRMLADKVKPSAFNDMQAWVQEVTTNQKQLEIIGSGGNINKLYRLANLKNGEKLKTEQLIDLYENLKSYTVEERMLKFKLRPDRADVIVPASEIFIAIAKAGNINNINVPTIGLADGIVHALFEEYQQQQ